MNEIRQHRATWPVHESIDGLYVFFTHIRFCKVFQGMHLPIDFGKVRGVYVYMVYMHI